MIPLVLYICNDIFYKRRIIYKDHFSCQAQYLIILDNGACFSVHYK